MKEEDAARTRLFDSFYIRLVYSQFGYDVCYWNGLGGDALTGVHLPDYDSVTFM